jgi:hypothetical protein
MGQLLLGGKLHDKLKEMPDKMNGRTDDRDLRRKLGAGDDNGAR